MNKCNKSVLLIDDDQQTVRLVLSQCAKRGIEAFTAKNQSVAIEYLENENCGLVFVSDKSCNCFSLGKVIQARQPQLPLVILSDKNCCVSAVKAVKAGFADYLLKPIEQSKIGAMLDKYMPAHNSEALEDMDDLQIIGSGRELADSIAMALKAAPTSVPVLIFGESGTGKELLSYLIHKHSKRNQGPYIRLNCAALNDSLLESELFGHEKGAFTGALSQRKGRFEMADGGTLLLDEITETGPRFQTHLLRVLEQQDFERVGGTENIKVNVRIISTTNCDILEQIKNGNFRTDLYYRLGGIKIHIPPIRDRKQDLLPLSWHFINHFAGETGREIEKIDPAMIKIFQSYNWPGNVRQLRNVIRTALILGEGPVLSLPDVSWLIEELRPTISSSLEINGQTLREIEQRAIIATLEQAQGNQSRAARVLGITNKTLREKVKKYRQNDIVQLTT